MRPEYPNTPEKKEWYKIIMVITEDFKKAINNFLKEIKDNTGEQGERGNTKIP